MLGIVPAAGAATRMQPWPSSKELLPIGFAPRRDGAARLLPISEYLLDRMRAAGAERICLVVSGAKSDLLTYYAQTDFAARLVFVLQPRPSGLCDAVFRAAPLVNPEEKVLVGLPDTIWYPRLALAATPSTQVHLVTFPASSPEEFDAVIPSDTDPARVARVEVKRPGPASRRVWGAITAPGAAFLRLRQLWLERGAQDQYLGDLLNAWIRTGEPVSCDRAGTEYWDVGTPSGYARAWQAHLGEVFAAAPLR